MAANTQTLQPLDTFNVTAARKFRPFRALVTDANGNWELKETGNIIATDYDNNSEVRRLYYEPHDENKRYKLGTATGNYRLVDHADIVQPFLDAGFEPGVVTARRGGLKLAATLYHPDFALDDTISWDNPLYDRTRNDRIYMGVGLWTDAATGHGIRVNVGFFRSICTNGLVSHILELGEKTFSSQHFTPEALRGWVNDTTNKWGATVEEMNLRRLPTTALDWPLNLLKDYATNGPSVFETMPRFVRETSQAFVQGMSQWMTAGVIEQLSLLRSHQEHFTPMDIVNGVTNLAYGRPAASARIYERLDRFAVGIADMAEIGNFKVS